MSGRPPSLSSGPMDDDYERQQQSQSHQQQHNPSRREAFESQGRLRAPSSGSTRGAFGPMPVDASTMNPEAIYEQQQEELRRRHLQHHQQQLHEYEYRNSHPHLHSNNRQNNAHHHSHSDNRGQPQNSLSTPGQPIAYDYIDIRNANKTSDTGATAATGGNMNMDLGQIAAMAIQKEGPDQSYHDHHRRQQHAVLNHTPLPDHPRAAPNNENSTVTSVSDLNYSLPTMYVSDVFSERSTFRSVDPNAQLIPDPYSVKNYNAQNQGQFQQYNANGNTYGSTAINNNDYSDGNNPQMKYTPDSGSADDHDDDEDDDHEEELGIFGRLYAYLFWDEKAPEFTSIQLNSWSFIIGVLMGIFTAVWGQVIEICVEFVWKDIPEKLLEWGVFTDLDGKFPLPHYMWVCPMIFGGILSYITASMIRPKVPGQNEWIESLQQIGLMDRTMFFPVVLLSTAGMASGLSLGPEMPLVLTAGMIGSIIAKNKRQSVLASRVLNLTAASAAIGGFFGFPMAGALFVLEIPHRSGLQYFEALSPSILASIISVITNRIITGNDVKGMFKYPFIQESLPDNIYYIALVYGMVGSIVGVCYAEGLLWLKHWVHDWFHAPHDDHGHGHGHKQHVEIEHEKEPLVPHHHELHKKKTQKSCCTRIQMAVQRFFGIEHEPTRAAVAGMLVGIVVGVHCMFLPHLLFWGEAQLQTMIDRGMTPLPVFGTDDEPTAIMTAYGYCIVDPEDERAQIEGMSTSCLFVLTVTKIIVVGLSLGTGVCGGHFWAPLFVGCAASHFFTDIMKLFSDYCGELDVVGVVGGVAHLISKYPCLAMLCIMGSTHVVTFRAHMAIMLVLTLSIKSFATEEKLATSSGDYSAIFPLLVVACFVPVTLTRNTIFYGKQTNRGDIMVLPEGLCEPEKEGITTTLYHGGDSDSDYEEDDRSNYSYDSSSNDDDSDVSLDVEIAEGKGDKLIDTPSIKAESVAVTDVPSNDESTTSTNRAESNVIPKPSKVLKRAVTDPLNSSMHSTSSRSSRRFRLPPVEDGDTNALDRSMHSISSRGSRSSRPSGLTKVGSFGKITNYQSDLLTQARERSASATSKSLSRPSPPTNVSGPNIPRHRRTQSTSNTVNPSPPKAYDGLSRSRH